MRHVLTMVGSRKAIKFVESLRVHADLSRCLRPDLALIGNMIGRSLTPDTRLRLLPLCSQPHSMFPSRRLIKFRALVKGSRHPTIRLYTSNSTTNEHDPLHILFCGSDAFSIYSLRALREL